MFSLPDTCNHSPFLPWIKPYQLIIAGASTGQCIALWFRHLFTFRIDAHGSRVRNPTATRLTLYIATIKAFTSINLYLDLITTSCIDYIGVKTHSLLWLEWLSTTPCMFYLVTLMDNSDNRRSYADEHDHSNQSSSPFSWHELVKILKKDHIQIQLWGNTSMWALYFNNMGFLPSWLHVILFIYSNIAMIIALGWQQLQAYHDYRAAKAIFDKVVTFQPIDRIHSKGTASSQQQTPIASKSIPSSTNSQQSTSGKTKPRSSPSARMFATKEMERQAYDNFCVAQCKMNSSMFMTFFFTVFPIIYYVNYFGWIDSEVFLLTTYVCSYVCKVFFTHMIADSHIEILDPNKFLLLEQRRQVEESRLSFLRYVFHEVRVPLNSLVLGLQVLQDSGDERALKQEHETLSMMQDATGLMSDTLNDVLSLQKMQHGTLELEYKLFSIKAAIASSLQAFRTQIQDKQLKVIILIDPKAPKLVVGDRYRIEHVLRNMLSNAVKFSDNDSEIEVAVVYERFLQGFITFSVRDHGPGISVCDQNKLFQPFVTIAARPGEVQKGRGTGLGLSICKTIVTLLGGTIGCQSKVRQGEDITTGGSEFYFSLCFDQHLHEVLYNEKEKADSIADDDVEFINGVIVREWKEDGRDTIDIVPIAPEPSVNVMEGKGSDKEDNENSLKKPEKRSGKTFKGYVMICDDVLSNRKMLNMILQRKGLHCEQVTDGSEAIELVKDKGIDYFDIIFMDSIMCNICGPEASQALRALGYRHLIIGVTGNAMDFDITSFEDAGADMVITKPVHINQMNKVLEYCKLHGSVSYHETLANPNTELKPSISLKEWVQSR